VKQHSSPKRQCQSVTIEIGDNSPRSGVLPYTTETLIGKAMKMVDTGMGRRGPAKPVLARATRALNDVLAGELGS